MICLTFLGTSFYMFIKALCYLKVKRKKGVDTTHVKIPTDFNIMLKDIPFLTFAMDISRLTVLMVISYDV